MEVRTKDIFIMNAFTTILLVVTISIDNLAQWFFVIREEGAALMIFKTIVGLIEFIIMNLDVANVTIISLIEGLMSHDA